MEPQSLSMELARFVFGLSYEQLPREVVDRTKCLILDALSAAIAGRNSVHAKITLGLVKDNRGDVTIISHGLRVPLMDAVFANSVLTTSVGLDDWASTYMAHPGAVVIPAAIAVGEQEGNSGTEVVTAVVAGYEIMGRVFLAASSSIQPRFRSTSVIGPFGAAAAAGKLLRLDDEQLADALGYAANFSSGFRECFATGFMERKFNDAMASRNGVTAALLAKAGAKASRSSLEGQYGFYQAFTGTTERLETATIDLGERFLVMDATYKPYPASAEVQIIVHLALSLVEQHAFKDEEVTEIIETVPDSQMTSDPSYSNPGPFTSRLPTVASAPFNLAATLLGRPVTDYAFYDNYDDPEVLKLAKKVRIIREKGGDTTRIEVTLRSGGQHIVEEDNVEFLVPTTDRVKAKFARLASDSLGENKVNRITDIVLNLSEVPDIRQLTRELQG